MTTNNKKILSIAFGIFGFAIRWGIAFLAGQALYIFAEILYYCLLVSPIENPSRDIAAAFSLGFVFALTSLVDMGENGFVPLPPHTALAMVAVLIALVWVKIFLPMRPDLSRNRSRPARATC